MKGMSAVLCVCTKQNVFGCLLSVQHVGAIDDGDDKHA